MFYAAPTVDKKGWQIHLQNMFNGDAFQVTASMLVNAAGPWVRNVLEGSSLVASVPEQEDFVPNVRLIKGSHIVISKLYEGAQSYILQQPDGRIVFTIPYEKQFTLVGTTDVPFEGDAATASISEEEVSYLCDAVSNSFKRTITAENIVWTYSGVRSLVDDGHQNASKITRDYRLYVDERFGPPILSVFGGKITTYRKLAEHAVNRLATFWSSKQLPPWTGEAVLPGWRYYWQGF